MKTAAGDQIGVHTTDSSGFRQAGTGQYWRQSETRSRRWPSLSTKNDLGSAVTRQMCKPKPEYRIEDAVGWHLASQTLPKWSPKGEMR
jgi:hypothetical protein